MKLIIIRHGETIENKKGIWEYIRNTSVSVFDIEENGNHKIHLLNCTKHLD